MARLHKESAYIVEPLNGIEKFWLPYDMAELTSSAESAGFDGEEAISDTG